jgi:hypothetical protein
MMLTDWPAFRQDAQAISDAVTSEMRALLSELETGGARRAVKRVTSVKLQLKVLIT